MKKNPTAQEILETLRYKHRDDVFVSECKTGSSWFKHTCRRMDAWAMPRSWKNPAITGYEIKVTRGDFLQDIKWKEYLAYCNVFYFVCPWKMIDPSELPGEAGLMWTSQTGGRLYIKKKAPNRNVTIPEEVFRYVLMSRSRIVSPAEHAIGYEHTQKGYWDTWLTARAIDREFGHRVSRCVARRVDEQINTVSRENRRLKGEIECYQDIRDMLKDMGLSSNVGTWEVGRKIRQIQNNLPPDFINTLSRLQKDLTVVGKLVKHPAPADRETGGLSLLSPEIVE